MKYKRHNEENTHSHLNAGGARDRQEITEE